MAKVALSPAARRDLDDLWLVLASSASPATADRLIDEILTRCADLTLFPEMGRVRDDIAPEARAIVVRPWIVHYKVETWGILIVRVVDGRRDLRRIAWPET